jgi:hypothetical protein
MFVMPFVVMLCIFNSGIPVKIEPWPRGSLTSLSQNFFHLQVLRKSFTF